jgi:hypothetical protein
MNPDEQLITRLKKFIKEKGLWGEWQKWVMNKYYIEKDYKSNWKGEQP